MNTKEQIIEKLLPHFNGDMQISVDTINDIIATCNVKEECAAAIHYVAEWFNGNNVYEKCDIDRGRYIGTVINLMTLLAEGDITSLVEHWVLDGLSDEIFNS